MGNILTSIRALNYERRICPGVCIDRISKPARIGRVEIPINPEITGMLEFSLQLPLGNFYSPIYGCPCRPKDRRSCVWDKSASNSQSTWNVGGSSIAAASVK